MRSTKMKRALIGVILIGGLAAGTAASVGVSSAAENKPAATTAASLSSVNNFGLSTAEAKGVQGFLARHWGYTDDIDGKLGPNSWKAYQRLLKRFYGYDGDIDGIPGPDTIKALQREMKAAPSVGFDGAVDGIAGPETRAAFKRLAANLATL